jgi:GH25 family lysozyme M1 (1,4-beta-N-acetylmuramidase)
MIHGFDISQYQAGLDMAAAGDAGMHFVFVRASSGSEADWACAEHLTNAEGSLLRGTYHTLQPEIPAAAQARTFYRALAESGGFLAELPPAVHVSETGLDEVQVRQFLTELEQLWQQMPLIHTSRSKWHRLVGVHRTWSSDYQLWVIHATTREPALPTPWSRWLFWQFAVAKTPFWPRNINLDVFNGTWEALMSL